MIVSKFFLIYEVEIVKSVNPGFSVNFFIFLKIFCYYTQALH
jgi:hypothetical protein